MALEQLLGWNVLLVTLSLLVIVLKPDDNAPSDVRDFYDILFAVVLALTIVVLCFSGYLYYLDTRG